MVGRPKKYFNEQDRNQAIQQCKNKYLRNKEWICIVCGNHDYKLAGRWRHLKTKKHKKNAQLKSNNI